ncbi:MAG: S8 family serine peptidase [Bacteroidales bacterium]|nr:S8 family serine peptidase [Bacteroidales bacterium]
MNLQNLTFSILLFCIFVCGLSNSLLSQDGKNVPYKNKYHIILKNKKGSTFNPYEYFDVKAIERRLNNSVNLYDSTDFPVSQIYVNLIRQEVDSIIFISRWFNFISVSAYPLQILNLQYYKFIDKIVSVPPLQGKLSAFQCVRDINSISGLYSVDSVLFYNSYNTSLSPENKHLLFNQINILDADVFQNNNIDGRAKRIAIFDGGFPGVNNNPVFDNIRKENRIIKTWNFANNKEFVYSWNTHGTMVMSCIAGRINDINIGLATGAEFLLARTEVDSEPFIEEVNWLAAAEWADKNGADIINSSLGYNFQRYFPEDMDGKTSFVAKAANLAARKGMLVVNAAGNEGTLEWSKIITPADADSVLTVGGIDPQTGFHISFSSFGPSSDKRLKPNVSAFGQVIAAGKKGLSKVEGTSFAAPLIAGFAACAWQLKSSLTNMQLFSEIQKSGSLYPYFDYAHGYGVPKASYFFSSSQLDSTSNLFQIIKTNYGLLTIKFNTPIQVNDLLYFNLQDSKGFLLKYYILSVESQEFSLPVSFYNKADFLNIHFRNQTLKYKLNTTQ